MKDDHLRWVPHSLIDDLRTTQVAKCQELLQVLESRKGRTSQDLVTGDETWIYLDSYDFRRNGVCLEMMWLKIPDGR
jgi:hypothetical protein